MSGAKVRCRNWTPEETELFSNVLTDEDNRLAASLERLALKEAASNEVFDHIKRIFDRERGKKDFKDKNEETNFCNKNGDLQSYSPLNTPACWESNFLERKNFLYFFEKTILKI